MTVKTSDLKKELETKYDLVCFEDLADIVLEHGKIFSLFKQYHQKEFASDQRLVFYSSNTAIEQKVFDHLQYAASKIDISNFFILVCGPDYISDALANSNKLYGYDVQPIEHYLVDLEDTKPLDHVGISARNAMCPLPFGALSVSGDIFTICCKIDQKFANTGAEDFKEVFQYPKVIKLREQIKQGQRAPECQTCWTVEDFGSTSLRSHALDKFKDVFDQQWIDDPKIRCVDFNISSLCNFKCRICEPRASSQWAVEELQHTKEPNKVIELQSMIRKNSKDTLQHHLESLLKLAPDLEQLHVMGGEPFMLPILDDLIEQLVVQGHADHIQLDFNTNGSVWPEKVIARLQHFKKTEILLSIDNIGHRFELERGGNWTEVENNIRQFAALNSSQIVVKLSVTVNIQNLLYLDKLVEFAQSLGLDMVWWYLEYPSYLCIDNVSQEVKNLVYQQYHAHPVAELAKIADRMNQTPAVSGQEFLDRMALLDQRRNEDFSKTHPEIFLAMGGEYK